ncbi:MAG: chorismate-binding protein [Bacteroidota bacterium]
MLIYRLPRKKIVQKSGRFIPIEGWLKEGFIVGDFEGEHKFIYEEGSTSSSLYFKKEKPYIIEKQDYLRQGNVLISAIKNLGIQKTVLSRVKEVDFDESKSLDLFHLLEQNYPEAFVYLFSDSNLGTWIGATPEVLLRKINQNGFTISLAGTKKSTDTELWNIKEKREQAYVTEFIEEELKSLHVNQIEKSENYEYFAGPVKHLRTDFSFTFNDQSIEDVIKALHPTPAVCGLPQNLSLEVISQIEPHNREFYAGFIGEIDNQNAAIYVNLRCCQILSGKIYLYLGGGYTVDSNPEVEWQETENKSRTILDMVQKL